MAINLLEHHPGVIRISARVGGSDDLGRSEVRILDPEPDERAHFARELHDGLGQVLTSLSLFARSIEGELNGQQRRRLAVLRVLADEALATTRSLAWSLRASVPRPEGLAASLRSLAETLEARTGLLIEIVGDIETRFAVRTEAAVYKIVEEALTNVMRHASAGSVTISLSHAGETLGVVIEDDGAGFETAAPDARSGQRHGAPLHGGTGLATGGKRADRVCSRGGYGGTGHPAGAPAGQPARRPRSGVAARPSGGLS